MSVFVHFSSCEDLKENIQIHKKWHRQCFKTQEVSWSVEISSLCFTNFFCSLSDLESIARTENFPELPSIDQQTAFYSYFNRASAMQMFTPQLFAHQAMMSSWPFHPTFFSGWPLTAPLPYTSPNSQFLLSSPTEANNNNYMLADNNEEFSVNKNESDTLKRLNQSPFSGSDSQMNDSVEMRKIAERNCSTKQKIFECKTCNKTFGYKHVLQNHEKVHTGEKSFRCLKCNKCFRRDHHLKVHMRLHSGEKPYNCTYPMCDRQFVQVANLRRHLKTHEHATRLNVHEKLLKTEDKVSHQSFISESSEESLDLRKSSKVEFTFYESMELNYESPEQSEPEDLSTKSHVRKKE